MKKLKKTEVSRHIAENINNMCISFTETEFTLEIMSLSMSSLAERWFSKRRDSLMKQSTGKEERKIK